MLKKIKPLFAQVSKYAIFAVLGLGGASYWQLSQLKSLQPPEALATVALLKTPASQKAFSNAATERLRAAIQTPTLSFQSPNALQREASQKAFDRLHKHLETSFPLIYQQLKPERKGNSLLIHWPAASQLTAANQSLLLAAHLDVVPAVETAWQHKPFSGALANGFVWGRGTLDDKATAMAMLEALERQLAVGHAPAQDIYLALGEDEEIGGAKGAQSLAKLLSERGVQLSAVLDEGLVVVPGSMIGLKRPVALIGLAEKGYLTLNLVVDQAGGHTSMPAKETAVDILAHGLVRLQQNPFPAALVSPASELFKWLAPEMSGFRRWALANLWLTESFLLQDLQGKPATAALVRTTVAPTMLSGSSKENVLATRAVATLNLRLLPGDTVEKVKAHFKAVLKDERVQIEVLSKGFSGKASRISSTESPMFGRLSQTIRQTFPDALVAPSLVLAATDSRHYEALADNTYRFQPVYLNEADLDRLHGHNERISVEAYLKSIGFFEQLFVNLQNLS